VSVVDSAGKHLEVIVDDSQLSLAIGKKGQNVRLAAKLLGWKIDIKSEEEKRQEVEQQMSALVGTPATPLDRLSEELGEALLEKLAEAGVTTVEALADMHPEQLEAIPGIGPKSMEKIFYTVNNYFSSLEVADGGQSEEAVLEGPELASEPEAPAGAEPAGQSGENTVLSDVAEAAPESVNEPVETEQNLEASIISGVENAPPADEAEVATHEKSPGEDEIPPEKK
jgi:N utilization substance protein A